MLRKLRWKGKIACPSCGCISDIKQHGTQKNGLNRYLCLNCSRTFNDTTGTIFSKSKVPIWKWMYVLIILFESTASISAAEVQRSINVSYPTALNIMKRLRKVFECDHLDGKLFGVIESDEAWFGKKNNQQIMLGMVEREGSVKLFPIIDRKEDQLYYPHLRYVKKGSIIMTDGHMSYSALSISFIHHWVNHSIKEWTRNHIWTNTIEGVWSMLKGIIRTIHHGVSKRYLQGYCNLFAFRYSHRHLSFNQLFPIFINKICQPRCCLY